ncbi:winged helix-turn-helix domain-containing tetratricopeptide repeat protein [Vulcaniibacterium gelatinicum]|uniref:winged helix-turn-helix domain-containing tetratricopeptide repeat protein n=1 Tax=Vulcaniibacterium gelatinicum TaxID=2598725 RepID=UPI0011CB9153|nr:winged helix-turn-helix domain-containing protein [Vulcaniibacterium gelatinicum]
MASRELLRFGDFDFDPASGELWRSGERVHLQDHPCQVLELLLTHAGEVVTREAMKACLWPNRTFIDTDVGLNTAMRKLRAALGDDSETPRYVETLPRRGYRLLVPVVRIAEPMGGASAMIGTADAGGERASPRWRRRVAWLALAGMVAVAMAALVGLGPDRRPRASAVPRTIAVLPLANLSNDPSQQYFADGMTDALITELARQDGLRVLSRTTMLGYRSPDRPLAKIARELDADVLVEGSVLRQGNRVRITAQLVDARDTHLWAESYEGDLRDILGLQQRIAGRIAREVVAEVAPSRAPPPPKPVDPAAYDAYLHGRHFWNKLTDESLATAIGHYQRAIALDPEFAPAYVGLADAYLAMANFGGEPHHRVVPLARKAVMRALEIDDGLSDAHSTLGQIHATYDWDWTAAEQRLRRALALDPGNALAHQRYSLLLLATGRRREALAEIRQAAALAPLSPFVQGGLCRHYVFVDRLDEAIAACRHTLELDPLFWPASSFLRTAYARKRMDREWAREWERAALLRGDAERAREVRRIFDTQGGEGLLRFQRAQSIEQCRAGAMPPAYCIETHVAANDLDAAFAAIEQALEQRDAYLLVVDVDSVYAPLRADPRYADFRRRLGLPDAPVASQATSGQAQRAQAARQAP